MTKNISEANLAIIRKMQQSELTESVLIRQQERHEKALLGVLVKKFPGVEI